ncbi:MaoC family dehydratase [Pilimelia columellifera]|uniref:MaoC family dehydratase n=1 Tax=Pilimelia columellifera subsp. columellifera TaxID=706583 RepID=A0ABP6AE98_9ACTN
MRTFGTPAELAKAVGEHLGYSGWRLVDQAQVDAFAEATGDRQWIHTDPERAAQGPYGTTIAHGYLLLSLLPSLVTSVLTVEGARLRVNYGLNKVRFPAALPTGSAVRAGVRVTSAEDVSGGVQLVLEVTVEREGGQKPVCVAETVTRIYL